MEGTAIVTHELLPLPPEFEPSQELGRASWTARHRAMSSSLQTRATRQSADLPWVAPATDILSGLGMLQRYPEHSPQGCSAFAQVHSHPMASSTVKQPPQAPLSLCQRFPLLGTLCLGRLALCRDVLLDVLK
jgi:hypothetical protein